MGHGKLKKFSENETFTCLLQPDSSEILAGKEQGAAFSHSPLVLKDHPVKGRWNERMFGGRDCPIVLELGCGKGEYTVDLALRNPGMNYVGVDIKGARMWKGAKQATEGNIVNAAFLRTRIEFVEAFFAPGEVSEIWLTFSDPQMKSENSRLVSPMFLERYRKFLKPGGVVHLKTDSTFLFEYTRAVCSANGLKVLACTSDLYSGDREAMRGQLSLRYADLMPWMRFFEVQTFYEKNFLKQGFKINYISFTIDREGDYIYPEFDAAYWRAAEAPRFLPGHQF